MLAHMYGVEGPQTTIADWVRANVANKLIDGAAMGHLYDTLCPQSDNHTPAVYHTPIHEITYIMETDKPVAN